MNRGAVLIVDDDPDLLKALPEALRIRMSGLTVETADSAAAALQRIADRDYDAVVTDIKMPGMDGLELLAEIRSRRPDTPTLMITGLGETDLVVEALRGGACDFIQKPIDREYFVASLRRAMQMRELSRRAKEEQLALERHISELESRVEDRAQRLRERKRVVESPVSWMEGATGRMEKVVQQIKQVAPSPLTVLIEGETGTGKELAARAIHQLSGRSDKPFVAVDCGAIPETLIESELFGYERGRVHRSPSAEGGTVPTGPGWNPLPGRDRQHSAGNPDKAAACAAGAAGAAAGQQEAVPWTVRIIAASNMPLEREVRTGRFRADVYYRSMNS